MSKKQSNNLLTKIVLAALFIVVGILFIVKPGEILNIAFTVLGAALIIYGIIKLLRDKDIIAGIILIVVGIVVIIFGWQLQQIACIIAGALLIVYSIYALIKKQIHGTFGWLQFIACLAVGICLCLGYLSFYVVFIIIGVLMIVYGILFLLS